MKDKVIAKVRSRKFLNADFGMAAIQIAAYYNEYVFSHKNKTSAPPVNRSMDIDVTISDCGQQITLSFDAYTEKARKQRIAKVNLLINELEKVRDVLEAGEVGSRKGEWE